MTTTLARSLALAGALCVSLVAARLAASDKTLDLGSGRAVIFDQPAALKMEAAENPDGVDGKTIKLVPRTGANAECNITFFVDGDKRFADHEAIKKMLLLSAASVLEQSLEGKVNAREFKTPHAFGYAATLTDKNLIGKPAVKGDYKSATFVILSLPEQIAAVATVLVDDPQSPEYDAMIALLRSLGVRTASSLI